MSTIEERHAAEYGNLVSRQEKEQINQLSNQHAEIKAVGSQTKDMADRFNAENSALKKLHSIEIKQLQAKQEKEKGKGGGPEFSF